VAEENFNRFMMTWDGRWGADVEYQYQHHQHHHQQHQQQHGHLDLPYNPSSSFEDDEDGGMSHAIHYNHVSVLSIAPQTLLPMIVSQVTYP
jgi:hypothetical protein